MKMVGLSGSLVSSSFEMFGTDVFGIKRHSS